MACSKCGKSNKLKSPVVTMQARQLVNGTGAATRAAPAVSDDLVLMIYVGTRYGSVEYRVETERYYFGQNRSHSKQLMAKSKALAIASENERSFVIAPVEVMHSNINLGANLNTITKLVPNPVKTILAQKGFQTIGQVLTVHVTYLQAIGIGDAARIQNDICRAYGLPLMNVETQITEGAATVEANDPTADAEEQTRGTAQKAKAGNE